MKSAVRAIVLGLVLCAGCGRPESDVDSRVVAQWVLERGGRLTVDERSFEITRVDQLPEGKFEILRIDLDGTQITDGDLARLEGLRNLRHLNLHRTDVGDAGMQHLSGLTSLKELELSYTNVGGPGFAVLGNLRELETLYLYGTNPGEDAVRSLTQQTGARVLR